MISVAKTQKTFLIGLFLVSFLIRSLVFVFYLSKDKNYWQVDSNTYHRVAVNLAEGKGLSADGQKPIFYRLPGYSLFLAAYYKLFGVDTENVLWFQIFVASFIPILIFILSLILFPGWLLIAKIASAYSAIHMGLVLYSGFFMTESFFIFFLLLFLILFLSSFHLFFCSLRKTKKFNGVFCPPEMCQGPGFVDLQKEMEESEQVARPKFIEGCGLTSQLFFAGLFLGVASLIRPVGHYLVVISVLLLLFSSDTFKQKIKHSFILFLGWFIPVFPWLLRSYLLLGQIFFHTLPGGHFLYFSAARVAMYPQQCSYEQARENLTEEVNTLTKQKEAELGRKLNEIEACDTRMAIALKYFKKYPFISLQNWLTDIFRVSLSLYSSELVLRDTGTKGGFDKERTICSMFKRHLFPQTKSKVLPFIIWYEILLYFFILLGFALAFFKALFNKNSWCIWLRVLPFAALFIVIGLSGGYSRMRLPIEPFLIIFSFSFWDYCYEKY